MRRMKNAVADFDKIVFNERGSAFNIGDIDAVVDLLFLLLDFLDVSISLGFEGSEV